jgi:aspartyl aminopeptidase
MKKLFEILETATSQYHTVAAVEKQLLEQGFESLKLKDNWDLKRGGKYFLNQYGSSIFAFTIGEEFKAEDGYRIGASHGDFPAFRIKPNAGMENGGYLQLNTEPYGGLILSSWMDRPLSVAGRVVLKSDDVFHPDVRMIDMKRPVLIIPNLAIHFDREINSGKDFKKQVDMIPIYATSGEGLTKDAFMQAVAKELGAELSDILDYELTIYPTDKPEFVGLNAEFVSSPRLDNITSTQALIEGITAADRKAGINMICVFDHEEIGSRSKQGACSTMLPHVIEKIYLTLGYTLIDAKNAMDESMLMSVDVSHAYHPNYGGKYDVTNRHIMNKGFAIKEACSQSYATDCEAISIVQQICDKEGIAYQKFSKYSDSAGGGTLGCISSAVLPVRTVDIGVPLWGMHSSRETMGVKDYEALVAYLKAYYSL